MSLPELADWKITSGSLHQIVSLVGPIHKALLPHRNNYMHLAMWVKPGGLASQTLPGGGKIHIDLKSGCLIHLRSDGQIETFPFSEHTQASLFEALLMSLGRDGLGRELGLRDKEPLAAGLVDRLVAQGKARASLTLEGLTRTDPLVVDRRTASAFADVMFSLFTALARFKARLQGSMTPLIVWPEHFDLSTLWFHPSNPEMADDGPHVSVGFAPFTPGQYEYPYLYAYAYPYPEPFDPPVLAPPAFWHDEGWRGAVVRYEDLARQEEHETFVEEVSMGLFRALSEALEP